MEFLDKSSARAYFSSLRSSILEEQRHVKSEKICQKISSTEEFLNCDTLLLYYPIKTEPSALSLLEKAFSLGKSVAFPISIKENYTLDFRVIESLDDLLVGAYGICEPTKSAPKASITNKTLCIVPALSFDEKGMRLGYGKGFYDRFLSEFPGYSIGITYSELFCKELPIDKYDIPVNKVITD